MLLQKSDFMYYVSCCFKILIFKYFAGINIDHHPLIQFALITAALMDGSLLQSMERR